MGSDKIKNRLRIRVKMLSGKIYGPYQRSEILRFIKTKKLTGEENILYEGESQWKQLSSDPEFFDCLQEVILGVKPKRRTEEAPGSKIVEKTQQSDPMFRENANELAKGNTVTRVVENKKKPTPAQNKISKSQQEDVFSAEREMKKEEESSSKKKHSSKKPHRMRMVLLFLLLLCAGWIFLGSELLQEETSVEQEYESVVLRNQLNYTKALSEQMQLLRLPEPQVPLDLYKSEVYNIDARFGAHNWIQVIKEHFNRKESGLQQAEYWVNLAWASAWLAEILENFSSSEHKRFSEYSRKLIDLLEDRGVFDRDLEVLFLGISDVVEGNWLEVIKKLSAVKKYELAQWFVEEAYWMKYWEEDAKIKIELPSYNFENKFLKTSSAVKKSILMQSSGAVFDIKQILNLDGQSWSAWFLLSEYNWRIKSTGVSQANRYFLTGLTVQSLYPKSYQKVFWAQFFKFRNLFGGEGGLLKKIKSNYEVLLSGEQISKKNKKWYDIGTDVLRYQDLGDEILRQSASSELDTIDMSSLEVISRATIGNDEGIYPVIHDAIFTRQWAKAERLIKERRVKFPKDPNLVGFQVWLESERYNFDQALLELRRLEKIPGANSESLLYSGVLHVIARHHTKGREDLTQYAKQFPQTSFAYYFIARSYIEEEKYVDCTKNANMARVHGEAVVHFQAQLLYYNCRVQATLAVDEAVRDLKQMLDQDPDSIPLNIEYVRALMNAGKKYRALKAIERVVVKFPYSYKLKLMMGEVEEARGELAIALLLYNEARKLRPDLAETGIPIAKLYERENRYTEAAQQYEAAGLSDPGYPEIFLMAARTYRKAGRIEKAHQMYMKEIGERKSSMVDTFIEAAEFMLESNAPKLVPELFKRYGGSFREDPRVSIRLAQSYMAVQDLKSAEKYALLAKGQGPDESEPYRILGDVYEGQGQYQLAKEHYQKFLYLLPQSPDAARIRDKLLFPPYR